MKTCYFHIGFHKTATTTLQQICGKNRDILEKAGIYYPKFIYPEDKGNLWNHSGPLTQIYKRGQVKHFKSKPNAKERRELRSFNQNRYLKSLKQDNDLFLSGEALSCWPKEYYLNFLKDLKVYGYSVKVLALVRTPYSFACSAIQETLKSGRYHPLIGLTKPYRIKGSGIQRIPDRTNQIKTLKDVFGASINFQPFSKAIEHPQGPVAFCFEELGLPLPWSSLHQDSDFRSNLSLNNLQARAMNLFNKQLKLESNRRKCTKASLKLVRQGLETLDSGRFLLTEKEFRLVKQHYKQINKDTTNLLGPEFSKEAIKFSDPVTDISNVVESLARSAVFLASQPNDRSSQVRKERSKQDGIT